MFSRFRSDFRRWRNYRRTYAALSALDTRGLNDLGISRSQIREIALRTAGR